MRAALLILGLMTPAALPAQAILSAGQDGVSNWCKDSGTYCWFPTFPFLSGLRIVGEPKFGYVFAGGKADNRISTEGFGRLNVIGLETNLAGSFLAVQLSVITPGKVTLDEKSPLRTSGRLDNKNGEISVDGGLALGLSLMDGIMTLGYGRVRFDKRDIANPVSGEARNEYFYLNLQPISSIRTFVKQRKE